MQKYQATAEQAIELRIFAESKPQFQRHEIEAALSWTKGIFFAAVRRLRAMFDEGESTVTLVPEPQGKGEQWLYRLTGVIDDTTDWAKNRFSDLLARINTFESVVNVLIASTPSDTAEAAKLRITSRRLEHLNAEMTELDTLYNG